MIRNKAIREIYLLRFNILCFLAGPPCLYFTVQTKDGEGDIHASLLDD